MNTTLEKVRKAYELLSRDEATTAQAMAAGRLLERLESGNINISIIGQFKRGKSSLANRILGDEYFPDAESEAHKCHEIGLKMGYDEAMRIKGECENDNKILIKGIKSDALSEARGHVLLVRSYYDDCREKFHQIIENLEYARTVFDKLGEYKDAAEQAKLILDFKSEIQYNMYNVEELISETKAKERYRQVRFWVLLLLILGVFFLVCLLLFGW